jgi:hypothetical protein
MVVDIREVCAQDKSSWLLLWEGYTSLWQPAAGRCHGIYLAAFAGPPLAGAGSCGRG